MYKLQPCEELVPVFFGSVISCDRNAMERCVRGEGVRVSESGLSIWHLKKKERRLYYES